MIIFDNNWLNKNKYTYEVIINDEYFDITDSKINVYYKNLSNNISNYEIVIDSNENIIDQYDYLISIYTYRQNSLPLDAKRITNYVLELDYYKINNDEIEIKFFDSDIKDNELKELISCLYRSFYEIGFKKMIIYINNQTYIY